MTKIIFDPTYKGLHRLSLETLPVDEVDDSSGLFKALRLGGRAARFTPQVMFRDIHNIGYSRFDDKGSVLMANIDAVLNLSGHIGGYLTQGTEFNNSQFYSLLLEDHTLEMHSYMQWRRPLSVSRVIMGRVLTKPKLKTAQLDTILKTDLPAIISLKPCDGYNIVGLMAHSNIGSSVSLRDLVIVALVSLAVMHKTLGKGFVVFPFSPEQRISGTLTDESILDLSLLLMLLYKKVWLFRPYMCHNLLCLAFAEHRPDPEAGSPEEKTLLSLWNAVHLLPTTHEKKERRPHADPAVYKVAEIEHAEVESWVAAGKDDTAVESLDLDVGRNFSRLFDGINISIRFPKLAHRVRQIMNATESPARDRVEVLSRWQLPDTIETTRYPF